MSLADGQLPATFAKSQARRLTSTHGASQVYSVQDIESDECASERAKSRDAR
ncbi:hypothetical protein KVT40_008162 [Elsinoe batatas]|uniref:Uncharacterized protein n=1 Tax=Elsinoe batatas TaxID=2601811 RepID=A0A8K0KSP1_9PEZI|nr:hypothetical protein KVT40_008162 [Elsinoe batatas]